MTLCVMHKWSSRVTFRCGKGFFAVIGLVGLMIVIFLCSYSKHEGESIPKNVSSQGSHEKQVRKKWAGHSFSNKCRMAENSISRRIAVAAEGGVPVDSPLPDLPKGLRLTMDDILQFANKYEECGDDLNLLNAAVESLLDSAKLSDLLILLRHGISSSDAQHRIASLTALTAIENYRIRKEDEGGDMPERLALTQSDIQMMRDILTEAVNDPLAEIRELGVMAALEMPDDVQTMFLAAAIGNDNVDVRKLILEQTAASHVASDTLLLCQALDDSDLSIKQQAAEVLHNKFGVEFSNTDEAMQWWEKCNNPDSSGDVSVSDSGQNDDKCEASVAPEADGTEVEATEIAGSEVGDEVASDSDAEQNGDKCEMSGAPEADGDEVEATEIAGSEIENDTASDSEQNGDKREASVAAEVEDDSDIEFQMDGGVEGSITPL